MVQSCILACVQSHQWNTDMIMRADVCTQIIYDATGYTVATISSLSLMASLCPQPKKLIVLNVYHTFPSTKFIFKMPEIFFIYLTYQT